MTNRAGYGLLIIVAAVSLYGLVVRHPRLGLAPLREVARYELRRSCEDGSPEDVHDVYELMPPHAGRGGRGLETNDIQRLFRHVVAVERVRGERCRVTLAFDRGRGAELLEHPGAER